jgi:transposase
MSQLPFAHLGLDISKATLDAALLPPNQSKSRSKVFPNTPTGFANLVTWINHHTSGPVHACLEATGTYSDGVALFLHEAGFTVSVVNPLRIKGFAQSELSRNKTDRADAKLIALFCRQHQPPAWTPPPPERLALRSTLRRIEAVTLGADSAVAKSIAIVIACFDDELKRLNQQLRSQVAASPELKRQSQLLDSIPGIGFLTAVRILAELDSVDQYSDSHQFTAQAGLTPRQHSSGTSVKAPSRLSKLGNSRLRKALFMPAVVAKNRNPLLAVFCQRLLDRGKPKMVVVCAAMRKLLQIAFGVLKSGQPFDPNYSQNSKKFA